MLAFAITSTVSRSLSYGTIYTTKLLRRGTDIDRSAPWRALQDLKVADGFQPFQPPFTLTRAHGFGLTAKGPLIVSETTRTLAALWTAAADIPVLLAEVGRLHSLLILARVRHADLTAAARAVIGAERDGENDPLWYIRDELATNGKLPPRWLSAPELLYPDGPVGSEEAAR